jgi:alpha-galactosidase
MRAMVDGVRDAIIGGRMEMEPFLAWEASEPLRPLLRAAITGVPERIASAIVPNDGLVPALPADCAVEVSAVASDAGVAGDRSDDLPLAFTATLRHEVSIQQLLADAALLGSRDAALQALLIDPVVGSSGAAEAILVDFEAAHGDLWPALT